MEVRTQGLKKNPSPVTVSQERDKFLRKDKQMKKAGLVFCFLLTSCVARTSVIVPEQRERLGFNRYTIQTLWVENSRALFVPEEVVSNMCFVVFRMVMEKNGYTLSQDAEVQAHLRVSCLENDLLNNKQRVLIVMEFTEGTSPLAFFSFYAESKSLMLDQRVLAREFEYGVSLLKQHYKKYVAEQKKQKKVKKGSVILNVPEEVL